MIFEPVGDNEFSIIMTRTVAEKMGVKEDSKAYFASAPQDAIDAMALPSLQNKKSLSGMFDYMHLFVVREADLEKRFPKLKAHLADTGMLWVSWPKAKQLGTDLNIKNVIKIGYDFGLVESTALSVNDIWSALKFTHPKKGKTYNNSYGKLKENK